MIPRIETIKPLKNYMLYVVFKDGKSGFYDVGEDILQIPEFKDLKTITGLFENVKIDESRTCVFWSDFIDLPSDAIYENLLIDADYVKLTPTERTRLERAEQEIETVSHDKINWD